MTQQSLNKTIRDQSGVYIPLLAILLVGLLALIGFIIDAGTMERTQIQLQKAVDAGIIAGLDFRIQSGFPAGNAAKKTDIERRVKIFIGQNLALLGYDATKITPPTVTYVESDASDPSANNSETLTAAVSYDTPFLLMPFVPLDFLGLANTPRSKNLTATAKAVVPRTNIVLVLDTSTSMWCPSTDLTDCDCAKSAAGCDMSPTSGSGGGGVAKIYDLRRGVYNFLSNFHEGYDRIALVTFDLVGKTLVKFDRDGDGQSDGFQKADFEAVLGKDRQAIPAASSFVPGGMTNTSDGLITAYEELNEGGILGNRRTAVVLFTDGAPTAKESCYADTKTELPAMNDNTCPAATQGKRYVDFELEWIFTDSSNTKVRGPSPLIAKPLLIGRSKAEILPKNLLFKPKGAPNTDIFAPCSQLAAPDENKSTVNAWTKAYQNCLQDFGAFLPDGTKQQAVPPEPLQNFKKSYFHRAVNVADFLRTKGAIVYTIGIGPPSASNLFNDPNKSDIYEDINDDFRRKDGFLALLADNIDGAQSHLRKPDGSYPVFPYADTWEQRIKDKGKFNRNGLSVTDASAANVAALFDLIAHKIILRFLR